MGHQRVALACGCLERESNHLTMLSTDIECNLWTNFGASLVVVVGDQNKETDLVHRHYYCPRLPDRTIEPQWTQEGQNVVEKVSISLVAIHVLAASVLTCRGAHRLQK